jgi:hypothetical protein
MRLGRMNGEMEGGGGGRWKRSGGWGYFWKVLGI